MFCALETWRGLGEQLLYRFRDEMSREMIECRESADLEPFHTRTVRLPLRIAEGAEILLESERERLGGK